MLNSRNTHLIETSYDRLKSEKSFQQYGENLAKQEFFRWVTNIHEHKRYYYTFDNSLLFTESIQNTTQIFPAKIITSGFFRVSTGALANAIRVRAKPCVHRFNYSRTLPQRSSPSGLWT